MQKPAISVVLPFHSSFPPSFSILRAVFRSLELPAEPSLESSPFSICPFSRLQPDDSVCSLKPTPQPSYHRPIFFFFRKTGSDAKNGHHVSFGGDNPQNGIVMRLLELYNRPKCKNPYLEPLYHSA